MPYETIHCPLPSSRSVRTGFRFRFAFQSSTSQQGTHVITGGLDIGTSNCKLSVYDGKSLIIQTSASYASNRAGGRHSLSGDLVWKTVKSLFTEAVAKNPTAAFLKAIAVSSLGEAAVPVAADGKTLGDALLFWDASGEEECAALSEKLGKGTIESITGVIPHSQYTLCKIAWLKKHADFYSRVKHFLLFEDFIIYRLTGERLISYSLAGRTMGLDLATRSWSPTLFAAAGVDPELMSTLAPSGTPAGNITRNVAEELGIKEQTLVTTGGHDQMCVAVGAGAIREGIASNSSGTVEVAAVTLSDSFDPSPLFADNYTVSIHADPDLRFTYSCNSSGSLLLNWYLRTFATDAGGAAYDDFERLAPTQPTPLLVLPYIAGTGTPLMDFSAKGAVSGLDLDTTKYDIYRALMEGMCFDLCHNLDRLAADGAAISELRATGGGSQSWLWQQIKADVTGLPVRTLQSHQAAAMGCMILASTAAGQFRNIRQAVDELVAVKEVFEPNMEHHAYYRTRLQDYLKAFDALRPTQRPGVGRPCSG